MKATIRYRVGYDYHPFDDKARTSGVQLYILYRETVTASSTVVESVPVAIFNLDSEGQTFERFVDEHEIFHIKLDPNVIALFDAQRVLAARYKGASEEKVKEQNLSKEQRRRQFEF